MRQENDYDRYDSDDRRPLVFLAIIAVLVVAVTGLGVGYLNLHSRLSTSELDAKRAVLLMDKLQGQVNGFDNKLQTSETKTQNELLAATQALINDAKGSIVKSVDGSAAPSRTATFVVCASNAANTNQCDFVADGTDDQTEINLALAALPPSGGNVHLSEGSFSINGVAKTFGGILIQKSNVVLAGSGMGTKLTLTGGNRDTNVIRIIGNNLENITIRDMWIDANSTKQISTNQFEVIGIKARSPNLDQPMRNIVVENTRIENCLELCIYLYGAGVFIRNNWIGDAGGDTVELLGGPGEIADNHFEISGASGRIISVDAGDNINLVNNTIDVRPGGSAYAAIRSWAGYSGINIQNNVITASGPMVYAVTSFSSSSLISGNIIRPWDGAANPKLLISAGKTTLSDNHIENTDIVVDDSQAPGDVVIRDNILDKVTISSTSKNLKISRNVGYTTENSGTVIVPKGATTTVVNHGLVAAPTNVQLTPINNPANSIAWYWVSNITATQFTVNVSTDPGTSGSTFSWRATVGEG